MKNVLMIITTKFVSYGGLTTVAMNYYRHIEAADVHIDFASTNEISTDLIGALEANGSTYYRLPARKKVNKYYFALKKVCEEYDIVHVHANSATATLELQAAKSAGVLHRFIHIHNTTCSHKFIHTILTPLFYKSYTYAIACSGAAGEWIFPKDSFLVLNNAINLESYMFSKTNRSELRKVLNIEDKFVIGHVGKIVEQKNHAFLLSVFKKVYERCSDTCLLLVGDGELRSTIEQEAKTLGLEKNVIFTGMVDETEKFYSSMDCFAFPSLWEGLPLSLVEAQANGLKCIVSDKVTAEIKMTNNIEFMKIDKTEEEWATMILNQFQYNRELLSKESCDYLRNKGFDIKTNADVLKQLYLQM